jgi:hypothetical protein
MSAPIYDCSTEGARSLTTGAKSLLGVKAHANSGLQVVGFRIGFIGVTASEVPASIELCYCTWATNSPGTNSTSTTPRQRSGRVLTAGFTSGTLWTAEPTTVTPLLEFPLTPNGGLVIEGVALSTEPDCALAEGFVIRVNTTATVSARGTISVTRI